MAKNEAELEARISSILQNFPVFKDVEVEQQRTFTIKFGHHAVTVDLKDPSSYGNRSIFDVLLKIDGMNVILLELKKEGLALTRHDVDQGISYARLIDPMPPITLVSNGSDNQFYCTYNKKMVDEKSLDFKDIQTLIDNSFQLATNDFKNAVNLLLNNDPELFAKIINDLSQKKFDYLIGEIDDVSKSICVDFCIQRELLSQIELAFDSQKLLVGIVGSALSGKTNLLYQFFNLKTEKGEYVFYINCLDHEYSILQQLANSLTASSKMQINKDRIREWFINSVGITGASFYLVIDNFNSSINDDVKSDIIELIDIFKGSQHHVLYTIDEYNYKQIAFIKNRRYKTIIGEESKMLKLQEFSDTEFGNFQEKLFDNYRLAFENGAFNTPEYRQPRIVKHLIAINKGEIQQNKFQKIIAIPDWDLLLALASNKAYTNEIKNLYQKIAECFIEERESRIGNSELEVMAFSTGAVTLEFFKQKYPNELPSLIESSFVVLREIKDLQIVIYPKIPELIAFYSNQIITQLLVNKATENSSIKDFTNLFIQELSPIPYSDIIGAQVLLSLATNNYVSLFTNLVDELLKMPPKLEKINGGTETIMYADDIGHLNMQFESDMDEGGFMSNFLPYTILSQLVGYIFYLDKPDLETELSYNLYLIRVIGANEHFISRVNISDFHHMKPVSFLEIKDLGEFVDINCGIVEPIVQSIQKCFYQIPQEIELLYNHAFNEKQFPLLWRINLALKELIRSTDDKIKNRAINFVERFKKFQQEFIIEHLTKDITDEEEKKRLIHLLSQKTNPLRNF